MSNKITVKFYVPKSITEPLNNRCLAILNYLIDEVLDRYEEREWGKSIQPCIPLWSAKLRQLAGGFYCKELNFLMARGYIAVHKGKKTGKPSYFAGGSSPFCKKYRLSDRIKEEVRLRKFNVVQRVISRLKRGYFEETAILDCPATIKIARNYQEIAVTSFDGLDYSSYVSLQGIAYGITNVKRGEVGRITHRTLNGHSKAGRGRFLVGGESLAEVDAVSLHLYLLANFIEDDAEKAKWLEFCASDIYLAIVKGDSSLRKLSKKRVGQFLSGKVKKKTADIHEMIKEGYPSLYSWLSQQWAMKVPPQRTLQSLEASIFIPAFESAPFWCLPMHDGFMVKESNKRAAIELLEKAVFDHLGYAIPIQ